MTLRVKICCISSFDEAKMAIDCGASAIGLVSNMPSGPGVITEAEIASIAAVVPPPIGTFLLTAAIDAATIIAQQRRCHTSVIQLVDSVEPGAWRAIREALPAVKLVQVIHVRGEESVSEAVAASQHVDALLLDSGNPSLIVKELGGTGRTHDWRVSARITKASRVPVFLAGGLNASNVREAIEIVAPFGLDLCSSVRTNGHLDRHKLEAFFKALSQW